MHWLRDLMRAGPKPLRSLGAVAREALAHPGWPPGARPQPRSLSALLSKLDRGLELDWLGDRPAVQQVLADVLGAPRGRIAEIVSDGVARGDADRGRVRFRDLPLASPLDLTSEPLPPGIPHQVLHPARWRALWWVAPRGSGRSLLGAWLSARTLASFVPARDWETARRAIPDSGPVLVELWGSDGDLSQEPPRDGICVAAPFRPSARSRGSWTIIESEPPSVWLEPLVEWVARRLPRDGHFEPKGALEWLRRADLVEGTLDGLGSAIGLSGLLDEMGVKSVARLGVTRAAERFVRDRLAKAGHAAGTDTAWLEKNGPGIVVGLATRALMSPDAPWDSARPEATWMSLLPEEYRNSVDTDWIRTTLARGATPGTAKDIERALRDLPPGAFRVVRALRGAGLLAPDDGGADLVLGPCWLARWAERQARERLVAGGPADWGEALLARDPGWLARGLVARALSGDASHLEDVLDLETPREASAIAAMEMAFRAAGVAIVAGVDVQDETRMALWDQAMTLVVERDDGPHPRVEFGGEPDGAGLGHDQAEPLLDVGVFHLAALAISEALPAKRGRAHPLLRPWDDGTARAPRPWVARILVSVWRAVERFDWDETPWIAGAFELADRLRASSSASVSLADGELTPLEWPAELLRRIDRGTLTWSAARSAGARALSGALALAKRRGLDIDVVFRSVWLAWLGAPEPIDGGSVLSPTSPGAEALYAAAPAEALATLFRERLVSPRDVPYAAFAPAQWRAILHARLDALAGAPATYGLVPLDLLREAIGRLTLGAEDARAIWERDEAVALDALADALVLDVPRALVMIAGAPERQAGAMLEKMRELRALMPEALKHDTLRAWLHDGVARRAAGFRTALELLDDAG